MPEEALIDLKRALELDPNNGSVKVELAKAKQTISEANKKTKAAYQNLFSKISVYDDKALPVLGLSKSNPRVVKLIYYCYCPIPHPTPNYYYYYY